MQLFLLGANFPKFPKWAHTLGKFILGLLYKVQMWVTVVTLAEFGESIYDLILENQPYCHNWHFKKWQV